MGQRRFRTKIEPGHKAEDGHHDDDRHKVARHHISHALDGRFRALGVLHQLDDLGQGGILTHFGRPEAERARLVDRRPDDLVSRLFGHWQTLSSDHTLVHRAATLSDHAIHRHLFAGPHDHYVAHQHLFHGDVHLLAIPYHSRRLGLQAHQLLDGLVGLAFGARLQHLAQQDEGDDDGRGVKVHLAQVLGEQSGDKSGGDGVDVSRAGTQGDQGVHIGRPVAEGAPGTHKKAAARPDQHRRRQDELYGPVNLLRDVLQAGDKHRHSQRQHGCGQDGGHYEAVAKFAIFFFARCPLSVYGLVAQSLDRRVASGGNSRLELCEAGQAGQIFNGGLGGVDVDICAQHAGRSAQRLLNEANTRGAS